MGYDGKGQVRVRSPGDVPAAFRAIGSAACVLERLVDLACELSVVVARSDGGETATWTVAENRHRDGILDVSIVPARIDDALAGRARRIATGVATALDYRGVLCVELFVTRSGALLVNEIAPRPHNSGHYTMDACDHSQFDLQVRTLAGLPLVQPRLHSPSIMLNLLGDVWAAHGGTPPWDRVLALTGTHLHLYGKLDAKPGRKMGHLNITGASVDEVRSTALAAAKILGIEPF